MSIIQTVNQRDEIKPIFVAELKKWFDALNPGWDETQTTCFY
ncbi:MAG: hypothetical protein ABFS56_34080 [Pseudomonadota bacterium]